MAYTYTDAKDRMSAACFNVTFNLHCTPLDGPLSTTEISAGPRFEARHKITPIGDHESSPGLRAACSAMDTRAAPPADLPGVQGDARNADGLLNPFDLWQTTFRSYVPKDSRGHHVC